MLLNSLTPRPFHFLLLAYPFPWTYMTVTLDALLDIDYGGTVRATKVPDSVVASAPV